jgi:hypothetical protein
LPYPTSITFECILVSFAEGEVDGERLALFF